MWCPKSPIYPFLPRLRKGAGRPPSKNFNHQKSTFTSNPLCFSIWIYENWRLREMFCGGWDITKWWLWWLTFCLDSRAWCRQPIYHGDCEGTCSYTAHVSVQISFTGVCAVKYVSSGGHGSTWDIQTLKLDINHQFGSIAHSSNWYRRKGLHWLARSLWPSLGE